MNTRGAVATLLRLVATRGLLREELFAVAHVVQDLPVDDAMIVTESIKVRLAVLRRDVQNDDQCVTVVTLHIWFETIDQAIVQKIVRI